MRPMLRTHGVVRVESMLRKGFGNAKNVAVFVWTHPANEGHRIAALGRAATFQLRGRILRRGTATLLGTHSRIWAELHRTGGSKAVYANPPDYREMLVWKKYLRPGDLFIDVGANVGTYTIWAGDLGASVVALEPATDTRALLEANVALNGYRVDVIPAAAGPSNGTAPFTAGLDCANRMNPEGNTTVDMVRLDDVIGPRHVRGMKIDIEGFELDALRGCARALQEGRIDLLQLEWNEASKEASGMDRGPVADFLHEHGYQLFRPDESGVLESVDDCGSYGPDVFARRA